MNIPTFVEPPATLGWHSHANKSKTYGAWQAPAGGGWTVLLNRGGFSVSTYRLNIPGKADIHYRWSQYLYLPSPNPPSFWEIRVKVEIPGYPGGGYWLNDRWNNVQGEEHELLIEFDETDVSSLYHQWTIKNGTRQTEGDITVTGEPS